MTTNAHLLQTLELACEGFSDSFGGLTVSSSEIAELDGKIQNLFADVEAAAVSDPTDGPLSAAFAQATEFRTRWTLWRNEHTTFLSQTGDQSGIEFQAFQSEYNEKLRNWKESGGQTSATPDKSTGPLGDAPSLPSAGTVIALLAAVAVTAYMLKK